MQPGLSTHLFVYAPLGEAELALAAEAGFSVIEIWGARPHFNYRDPASVSQIASIVDRLGLKVDSFHSPLYLNLVDKKPADWLNLADPDVAMRSRAIAENMKLVDAAAELGARIIVLHHSTDRSGADGAAHFSDSLARLVEHAAPKGITLGIENLTHDWSVFSNLKSFTEQYSPAEVALTLDVGHSAINSTPKREITDGGDRIASLHVHDNNGEADQHRPPGEGVIDFAEVVAGLAAGRFSGPFMQELRDPDKNSVDLDRFKPLLEQARIAHRNLFP